jgi:5-methylcytosine-specific restriction endonuclease McrA
MKRRQPVDKRAYRESYQANNPYLLAVIQQNSRARALGIPGILLVEDWRQLCQHYENRCLHCGRQQNYLVIDHIVSFSLGGRNEIENVQPLCKTCNLEKYTKVVDYRHEPLEVREKRWRYYRPTPDRGLLVLTGPLPDIFDEDAYWDYIFQHDEFLQF